MNALNKDISVFIIKRVSHYSTDGEYSDMIDVALFIGSALNKVKRYDHNGDNCDCYTEFDGEKAVKCLIYPIIITELSVCTGSVLLELYLVDRDQLNDEIRRVCVPPKSATKK